MRVALGLLLTCSLPLIVVPRRSVAQPPSAAEKSPVAAAGLFAPTPDAFGRNKRLGRGVNVLGYDPIWQDRQKARFQGKYFGLVHEAGFNHIRVNLHPFRDAKLGTDGKPSDAWFETLDWTVGYSLANRLMVILDFHEFEAMGDDPARNKDRFLAVWRQIAEHCKDFPDDVFFEILNEPNKKVTAAAWNPLLREALAIIRQSNPNRMVIVGPTSWNDINDLDKLDLPEQDRNLIVTVHYYNPFSFTHQGAAFAGLKDKTGVPWNGTEKDQQAVLKDFDKAQAWAQKHCARSTWASSACTTRPTWPRACVGRVSWRARRSSAGGVGLGGSSTTISSSTTCGRTVGSSPSAGPSCHRPSPCPSFRLRNGPTAPARTRRTFLSPSGCKIRATPPNIRPSASTCTSAYGKGRPPSRSPNSNATACRSFCEQNKYALQHLHEKTIVGWMHGDEPDNAQSLPDGKGYGPPVSPEEIAAAYRKVREKDPTRPVMLNLGQGVAWDDWYGRGVRTNHPEDYAQYVRGGDIVSFDIYPAVHDNPAVAGKLWYVARGVERLRGWAGEERIAWNCIECTRISNMNTKPTPQQVKAEVWMSIIHGSQGLIYFCHQFQPKFIEAGVLADEEMARAVGSINREVRDLAEVINSPSLPMAATIRVSPPDVSADMARLLRSQGIAVAVKNHQGATYLFAVRMEAGPVKGEFHVAGMSGEGTVRVIGENRTLPVHDGRFADDFGPYAVHLYQIIVSGPRG